jgi:hypothetical protein
MQALYDSEITVKTEPDGCWDNASALESVIDDEISRAPGGEISEQQFCDPVLEASCLSSIHSVH